MTIGNIDVQGMVYPIKLFYNKRQSIGISTSGTAKVISTNVEELFIAIKLGKENMQCAQSLRSLIRNTANYSGNTITITPDPSIDLGAGAGVNIIVRYWSDNFDYVCENNNLFDFEFIFRKEIS
jgi:hypothetical protein